MRRIGIIAAMAGELKPLVQGWKPMPARQGESAWQGTVDGDSCIAVCAGMGKEAAERACAIAAQDVPLMPWSPLGGLEPSPAACSQAAPTW